MLVLGYILMLVLGYILINDHQDVARFANQIVEPVQILQRMNFQFKIEYLGIGDSFEWSRDLLL